jgi:hypothetical protein
MMSVVQSSGYLAAVLVFMTFYMKTMVPLRLARISHTTLDRGRHGRPAPPRLARTACCPTFRGFYDAPLSSPHCAALSRSMWTVRCLVRQSAAARNWACASAYSC